MADTHDGYDAEELGAEEDGAWVSQQRRMDGGDASAHGDVYFGGGDE